MSSSSRRRSRVVHVDLVFGLRVRENAGERKEAMAQRTQSCVLYCRFRTLSLEEGKDVRGGDCVQRRCQARCGEGERGRVRCEGMRGQGP